MSDQEHMHEFEVKAHMQKLGLVLQVMAEIPIPQLINEVEHASSIGPFFDPTGWMRHREAIAQNAELLRLVLPLWKRVCELKANQPNDADSTRVTEVV